jgi:hypothetical protein
MDFKFSMALLGVAENSDLESVKNLPSPQSKIFIVITEWTCQSIVVRQWEIRILGMLKNRIDGLKLVN